MGFLHSHCKDDAIKNERIIPGDWNSTPTRVIFFSSECRVRECCNDWKQLLSSIHRGDWGWAGPGRVDVVRLVVEHFLAVAMRVYSLFSFSPPDPFIIALDLRSDDAHQFELRCPCRRLHHRHQHLLLMMMAQEGGMVVLMVAIGGLKWMRPGFVLPLSQKLKFLENWFPTLGNVSY